MSNELGAWVRPELRVLALGGHAANGPGAVMPDYNAYDTDAASS
ncbi:MAG: hypothetical protein ACOYEV_11640 [Candidatus Nanopelagicales bacterium]